MRLFRLMMAASICVAGLATAFVSTSAQAPAPAPEVLAIPAMGPPQAGDLPATIDASKKTPPTTSVGDPLPVKRNPFWPIGLRLSATVAKTSAPARAADPPPEAVDWKEAAKHVRNNAKVSIVAGKNLVAFDGRIYDIGQLLDFTLNGYVYTFKVMEGTKTEGIKFEPQAVKPAEN